MVVFFLLLVFGVGLKADYYGLIVMITLILSWESVHIPPLIESFLTYDQSPPEVPHAGGQKMSRQKIFPGKQTCPLKINGWKMYFLLKWHLFRGHVRFQGCS